MKAEQEIKEKLKQMQKYVDTVPKLRLLREDERISFTGTNGAIEILKWVLEVNDDNKQRKTSENVK